MKKLLYLPLFAVLLFACDKDDDCKCEAEYINQETMGTFYVANTQLDCNTQTPTQAELDKVRQTKPSAVFVKCGKNPLGK